MSSGAPLLAVPAQAALRDELERLVLNDLLGPAGGPEEEIDERSVRERYLVGGLAPRRQRVSAEEDEGFAVDGDDSAEEGSVETSAAPDTMFPSSLGLSFCVESHAGSICVTARWGRYQRAESEHLTTETTGSPKRVWKRSQMEGRIEHLPLREGPILARAVSQDQTEVVVEGVCRRREGYWIVSLFLINTQQEPRHIKDAAWIFQPELIIEDARGEAIFCRRMQPWHDRGLDPQTLAEEQGLAMLYRRRREFAAGHGVGVHAELRQGIFDRAYRLSTRVVPRYELPRTESPAPAEHPELRDLVLDMAVLADLPGEALTDALRPLASAYAAWIAAQRREVSGADASLAEYQRAALRALEGCDATLHRIEAGIEQLAADERAAGAFRFMNRAMWQQRIHSLAAESIRRGDGEGLADLDLPANRTWYPFQLAFILLTLPGLTDLRHPDRGAGVDAVADLLWFPTGGGKTEAYLGLTAYTLALRRLQGIVSGRSGEFGVAVLMRYTLRLLTLQQFQRAAALICACEVIRREAVAAGDRRLGQEPFRLGLWVGQRTTPNWTEQSAESVKQEHGQFRRGSALGGSGSPAQLTNCPWCGTTIEPGRDIKVDRYPSGRARTLIFCGDGLGRCPFGERQASGEGLPILVVDEEIYRRLPALLIATVDKFAQMPWNGRTEMLFGQVDGCCERHGFRSPEVEDADTHPARSSLPRARTAVCGPLRPPDLIIQDELHLISGPLGTLTGLYETAIDHLASWEVNGRMVRPKVIASTATIRRAEEQVRALFLRTVNVFPPPAIDIEDNFFARQRSPSTESPGRAYLGICAPGRRLKATLIRVYVAHLAAAQVLYTRYGRAADPWMTLVGYFNAMRELGGMRRLVDDDVRQRLFKVEARGLARRPPPSVEELTSRMSSTDIPRVLDRLQTPFDPALVEQRYAPRRPGERAGSPRPVDVLLATNMISVGVDVPRLGLMVVAGQPKMTAEYIQATSRVGRSSPGLICTVFNWTRPRDLSHYERFEHYHATFYQQVEALSVTPFSPRALDRALTALLVSLIRLHGDDLNANATASEIRRDHPYVVDALATILARAHALAGETDTADLVERELERRLDDWIAQAKDTASGRVLGYQSAKDGRTVGLLHTPSSEPWSLFTCLNSLRDVEPSVNLILDDRGLDEAPLAGPGEEAP